MSRIIVLYMRGKCSWLQWSGL